MRSRYDCHMALRDSRLERKDGIANPWKSRYRRAQTDAATWLAHPGVLDLVRFARARAGEPRIEIGAAMPAIAAGFGIELLLDDQGNLADATVEAQPSDSRIAEWLGDVERVSRLHADLAVLASLIDVIVPDDAPFEPEASTLTLAELVLGDIDLDGPAAEIGAALLFPPSPVRLDHRGRIEASSFADDRDMRFGRLLRKGVRGKTLRVYNGGRRRVANSRAARVRVGAKSLVRAFPTMTALRFEPHWERLRDGAIGDPVWSAFAGPASWTARDRRYTTSGFEAILREVRRTG